MARLLMPKISLGAKNRVMLKTLASCIALCVAAFSWAQTGFGVVVKPSTSEIVPVLTYEVVGWDVTDKIVSFMPDRVGIEALLGYQNRETQLGYALVGNWNLSGGWQFWAGTAYLGTIESVKFEDLWERAGFAVGLRVKI